MTHHSLEDCGWMTLFPLYIYNFLFYFMNDTLPLEVKKKKKKFYVRKVIV